jgi:hypothetical protein
MTDTEIAPESEEEYEQRRQELIEEAKADKNELDDAQNEALAAIASEGGLEDYATVELGELEIEVKAWLPGDVEDTVLQAQQLGDSEDPAQIKRSMETMLSALAKMTVADDYDMAFWREFHERYGANGLIMAVDTVLGPANGNMEARKEGVDGFRQK